MGFLESFTQGLQLGNALRTMREQNRLRAVRDKILGQLEYDSKNHVSLPANFKLADNLIQPPDLRAETNAAVMPVPDIRAKAPAPVPGQFKKTSLADLVPKPALPFGAPKPIELQYTKALSMPELVAKNPMAFSLAGVGTDMLPWGARTQSENHLASLVKAGLAMDAAQADASRRQWYETKSQVALNQARQPSASHGGALNPGPLPDGAAAQEESQLMANGHQVDKIIAQIKARYPDATDGEIFRFLYRVFGYGR